MGEEAGPMLVGYLANNSISDVDHLGLYGCGAVLLERAISSYGPQIEEVVVLVTRYAIVTITTVTVTVTVREKWQDFVEWCNECKPKGLPWTTYKDEIKKEVKKKELKCLPCDPPVGYTMSRYCDSPGHGCPGGHTHHAYVVQLPVTHPTLPCKCQRQDMKKPLDITCDDVKWPNEGPWVEPILGGGIAP